MTLSQYPASSVEAFHINNVKSAYIFTSLGSVYQYYVDTSVLSENTGVREYHALHVRNEAQRILLAEYDRV